MRVRYWSRLSSSRLSLSRWRSPSVVLALSLLAASAAHAADWERVSDKEGIVVEWRKIDGARVREIRASGTIAQPLARVVSVLRDIEHWPQFMPPTEAVEILADHGDNRRLHVTINPSFVARRDYCLDVTWAVTAATADSHWFQIWDGCPPVKKGIVRHLRTDGTWHLRALDEHHTLVEYQAITDVGGSVPLWMVDRGAADTMHGMYRSLTKRANEVH